MRLLKQSTAADILVLMVDSTDHVTGKTGLTLTITASKAGGAFASITPTVTERGNGWYSLALTTTHTDTLSDLGFHVTGTGADPTDFLCYVVPRHLADLAFPATSGRSLAVESDGMVHGDLKEWLGGAPLALSSQLVQALAADIANGAIGASEAPLLANLDAAVSTRAPEAGGNVAAIKAKTDNLPSDPADESLLEAAIATRAAPGDAMTLTAAYDDAKTAAQAGDAMTLTIAYDAAKTAAQAGDSMALTSAAVDAVLDEVVEGTLTFRQMLRLFMAALANKSSGGGTTSIAFRDVADGKARISATVDSSGNRTAVTVDGA